MILSRVVPVPVVSISTMAYSFDKIYISNNYNFPQFIVGHHAKFPESILRKLFEYIEQGKTAKEASEDILHIKYTNSTTNRNFYEFYRRISKRELYYNISRDYNF